MKRQHPPRMPGPPWNPPRDSSGKRAPGTVDGDCYHVCHGMIRTPSAAAVRACAARWHRRSRSLGARDYPLSGRHALSSAGCAGSRRRWTQPCRRSRPPRGRRHAPQLAKGKSTLPPSAGSCRPAPAPPRCRTCPRRTLRIRCALSTAACWIIRRVSGLSVVLICSNGSAVNRRSTDWLTSCMRGSGTTISCARCSRAT